MSPLAFLHWKWLLHRTNNEVTAYGVTAEDDPFKVEFLVVPKQKCSVAFTSPHESALADLLEWACDEGLKLSQVGRIWLHTHPARVHNPSGTDWDTFSDSFCGGNGSAPPYAVMGIMAKDDWMYALVNLNNKEVGNHQFNIDYYVCWEEIGDFAEMMEGLKDKWEEEFVENVSEYVHPVVKKDNKREVAYYPKNWSLFEDALVCSPKRDEPFEIEEIFEEEVENGHRVWARFKNGKVDPEGKLVKHGYVNQVDEESEEAEVIFDDEKDSRVVPISYLNVVEDVT